MIVRPPGLPVTSTARPSRATTVGDCELSIRLPGAITLGGVPIAAVPVGDAGMPVEVAHLVVEQKAGPADHDVRTKFIFQRVGVGHRHAVAIDHGEMSGVRAFVGQRHVAGQVGAGGGVRRIDSGGQLPGVGFFGQSVGNGDEIGIAQIGRPIAIRPSHGFDRQMLGSRRPAAQPSQIERFEHVEHFDQHDSARAGERRPIDVVAAKRAVHRRRESWPRSRPGPRP